MVLVVVYRGRTTRDHLYEMAEGKETRRKEKCDGSWRRAGKEVETRTEGVESINATSQKSVRLRRRGNSRPEKGTVLGTPLKFN